MNRFNLTFSGEMLSGFDPDQVKLRFGKLFSIDDPVRLERFFSGQTIILRRNLERKEAAHYFHELQVMGAVAALVKVTHPSAATADSVHRQGNKASDPSRDRAEPTRALEKPARNRRAGKKLKQAAREKALLEQNQSKAQEAAAKRASDAAEAQRKAQESATKRAADRDEAQRKARELAARQAAEESEAKRKAAELAASRAAEKAEAQRKRDVERARQAAIKAEAERKAAEEAAHKEAALLLQQKREAEAAARLKAEREAPAEQQRIAAEESARREEAARHKAAAEQSEKVAAERAAAAQAKAERARQRRENARRAAQEKARKAREKRTANVAAAQRKAAEQQRQKQAAQEQEAERIAMEEQAITRGAAELALSGSLKTVRPRVKTSLEVPLRNVGRESSGAAPPKARRQLGEPNLYQLRAFRNSPAVRGRANIAREQERRGTLLGLAGLLCLLLLGGSFMRMDPPGAIAGASAITIDPASGPVLVAGDQLLFHDRAGLGRERIALEALGVLALKPPLAYTADGALLGLGQLASAGTATGDSPAWQLLRCDFAQAQCNLFSEALVSTQVADFVINPANNNILVADASAGELLSLSSTGAITARIPRELPQQTSLRIESGLLFVNSSEGPAISVLRYDDSAFGQQLDELLLLPPPAVAAEQSTVGDFLRSGGAWWVSLSNPTNGNTGLYRFDDQWSFLHQVPLETTKGPLQLVRWGEKTLVNDQQHAAIARFNAQGSAEAPLLSAQLEELITERRRNTYLSTLAWRIGALLCAAAALAGFGFAYLQRLRALVYKSGRERGAEPIDDYAAALHWIDPAQDRQLLLRRRLLIYAACSGGFLLIAIALSVPLLQLCALLVLLGGPAVALVMVDRGQIGCIGILDDQLLLVDHAGTYHRAGGSRLQYRGALLLIDDVIVFTGSRLLPAFAPQQVQQLVRPRASHGIRVDRATAAIKLLQSRHPLAHAGLTLAGAIGIAVLLLCLQGIF